VFRGQIRGHHTSQERFPIARYASHGRARCVPERIVGSRVDVVFIAGCAKTRCDGVSCTRYDGRALADLTRQGGALLNELEDYIRLGNPHFTDIRVEHATATEGYHTSVWPPRRWYKVTYLADDT
jgi:hypothetical protein